ncbi:MAG: pyruvate formate-lyase-activating protein [Alphaproteobacteria bacterium]
MSENKTNPEHKDKSKDITGYIHSVETGGMADGPGVRYIAFLSGCPLRCLYCHNPDMLRMKKGKKMSHTEILKDISRYASFLTKSRGGVTLSGGEPLCQPEFVKAILRGCKKMGLHTALDTSGYMNNNTDQEIIELTDLVLLDIKSGLPDTYKAVTKRSLEPTLNFARKIAQNNVPIWLRFVLVPGLTDAPENIEPIAAFAASLGSAIERTDVLPFHKMGEKKWEHTGLSYALKNTEQPTKEQISAAKEIFRKYNLAVY